MLAVRRTSPFRTKTRRSLRLIGAATALCYDSEMSDSEKRQIAGGCIGAVIGGFVGYVATAFVLCDILYQGSNLCGLPAAVISGPVGLLVGAVAGRLLARGRRE